MSFISSANMNLPIPVVGGEAGPQYAVDVNNALTIIDQHTHASGSGVPITPNAININTALTFNSNFATSVGGITLSAQSSTPDVGTIYEAGVDLYYVDGLGNNIQITQNGGVAGSPGSISNLTSPASASYIAGSKTFVWQSDTNIAANMDFAAAVMRNISPDSTFALTLQPPNALASNYSLTLPSLPVAQKFMTLDASGIMSAPWTVDGTTIVVSSNQLVVQPQNLPNSDREHNYELNGGYSTLTFPLTNIDAIFFAPYNITITSVWIYNGTAGSSGTTEYDLKVASPGGGFTSILSTTGKIASTAASNIWTDSGSVIATQTGVTKPVISTSTITAGQAVRFDLIQSMGGSPTDARIRIFYKQT